MCTVDYKSTNERGEDMREKVMNMIKASGLDENVFYSTLGEDSKSFWEKFNNDLDYTTIQMKTMVKLLSIKNPINFFYG